MNTQTMDGADKIINNHMWFSTLPGFFPVFLLDIVGITAVQLDMIKQLCKYYETPYNEQRGKAIVLSFTTSLFGRLPGYMVRSAIKAVPVVGWALGGAALSVFAASSTYAVGQIFKEHFSQGGTLNDLNPENFKKFYKNQFQKGKELFGKQQKDGSADEADADAEPENGQ